VIYNRKEAPRRSARVTKFLVYNAPAKRQEGGECGRGPISSEPKCVAGVQGRGAFQQLMPDTIHWLGAEAPSTASCR